MQREVFRKKSEENWHSAMACIKKKRYNAAASRFYYAVLFAARYWTDKKEYYTIHKKTHGIHVTIRKSIEDYGTKKHSEVFNELQGLRVTADYRLEHVTEKDLPDRLLAEAGRSHAYFLQ